MTNRRSNDSRTRSRTDSNHTMERETLPDKLLVDVVKRASLFELLHHGPREAKDLVENLDMSRSTLHRTTRSFVESGLLRESDAGFELTGFGRSVADEVTQFRSRVASANKLEEFLNTVEATEVDVPTERFSDADVIHPKPRQPHFAVKRIIELIEQSESVRMFSSIISPFYVDVAYREIMDGTEIDVVFDQQVIDIIASEYADRATEAARTGMFEISVRDELPFELFVFDDRIGMAAHDDNGIARVFVEADSPEAIEWAEDVYQSYRDAADRIDLSSF